MRAREEAASTRVRDRMKTREADHCEAACCAVPVSKLTFIDHEVLPWHFVEEMPILDDELIRRDEHVEFDGGLRRGRLVIAASADSRLLRGVPLVLANDLTTARRTSVHDGVEEG